MLPDKCCCSCGCVFDANECSKCPNCGKEVYKIKPSSCKIDKNNGLINGCEQVPIKNQIWDIGWLWYIALAFAAVILTVLILTSSDVKNTSDLYIGGCLYVAGAVLLFLANILMAHLGNKTFKVQPANKDVPSDLKTTNYIGFMLLGEFRDFYDTCVKYYFFSFFIPIFPIACYRVKVGATENKYKETKTIYHFYGSDKMNILEILDIYLWFFGTLAWGGVILTIIILLVDMI